MSMYLIADRRVAPHTDTLSSGCRVTDILANKQDHRGDNHIQGIQTRFLWWQDGGRERSISPT